LANSKLPFADDGALTITITPNIRAPRPNELIYHPRTVAIAVNTVGIGIQSDIENALAKAGIARSALALLLAHEKDCASPPLHKAASDLGVPLRYVTGAT